APSYQLAVVVDDVAMEIGQVVRGEDLLHSTIRQLLLYDALEAKPPAFAHVPILTGDDGARLSKRHRGVTLREMEEAGATPEPIVGRLAHRHGLRSTDDPVSPPALAQGFELRRIRRVAF